MGAPLSKLLDLPAPDAAKWLLGCELHRTINNRKVKVRIVETEAYDQNDPGSHTFRGVTPRNQIMFGPAGYLYVYFIYGMHFCANVVTGPEGYGEAALIRAVEPIEGFELMEKQRPGHFGKTISNGPSKLCSALAITSELNAHDLSIDPLKLVMKPQVSENEIVTTTRIGLKKGTETLWRFYLKDNRFVSKL